jgi:hypothetical protein
VRGLNDSGNPYRDQYQEWDRWAHANAKDLRMVDWGRWNAGEIPGSVRMIDVHVGTDGYPIPILVDFAQQVQEKHAPETRDKNACSLSFMAYGEPPAGMLAQLQAAEMDLKAQYVPPIPRWLAENPPQWAIVLSGGEVVTSGELGSGRDVDAFYTWRSTWFNPDAAYRRYDATGKSIGAQAPGDEHWYKLFWPQYAQVLGKYDPAKSMVEFQNGYVIVKRYAGKDILAAYDYDGEQLPVTTDSRLRDGNVWDGLVGQEIPALYAAQQRQQDQMNSRAPR